MWASTPERDEAEWDVTSSGESVQDDSGPDWLMIFLAAALTGLTCVFSAFVSVATDLISLCKILC